MPTDQAPIDTIGIRDRIHEFISSQYGSGRLILQEKIKPRVFRLRFDLEVKPLTLIVKCIEARVARRSEMVAWRWLPALGLAELGPPLLKAVGTPDGTWVWHIYSDLGAWSLADDMGSPQRAIAAVRSIAEVHKRFIRHPYMAEFRLYGGDLGVPFVESNLRDATIALEAITKNHKGKENNWTVIDRLLERLNGIIGELPRRLKIMQALAGPETLLHGDLWLENVFVLPGERVRLIDWDHVAAGPLAYDVSTFLLRFPPAQRSELIHLYHEAMYSSGWDLPTLEELNMIFETCEYARYACQMIWPAIALWESRVSWALEQLEEIDRWFLTWEPVLPNL